MLVDGGMSEAQAKVSNDENLGSFAATTPRGAKGAPPRTG